MQDNFIDRHIGPNAAEIKDMLAKLNLNSIDDLMDKVVPKNIRMTGDIFLPDGLKNDLKNGLPETEALEKLQGYADQNILKKSYIGMGYYNTITPPVIQRNVLEHPGWYTAYTPYQPEISQGRLEALLNFQQILPIFPCL
jgi:glycine dehydrogenase